jgi:copper(I)-binding protein
VNRLFVTLLCLMLSLPATALSVSDAYVRGLPPGQKNTAAFFVLKNDGDKNIVLSPGRSDAVAALEIHGHEQLSGMMRMRKKEQLEIAPGETLSFSPGGLHLMMIGLKKPLKDGDTVSFSLRLNDKEELTITAPVISVLKMDHSKHQHNGEH